jgi:hypothetical protein
VLSIRRCELPAQALHQRYKAEGDYVDCYTTVIRGAISHAQFVDAFYTTWLFKLERLILFLLLAKPSTDEQVHQLANGELNAFAAWIVESRVENQLLMYDFQSKTRSWLMVALEDWEGDVVTRLYFGSVVVTGINTETGQRELSPAFKILLPIHKLYARALLSAARQRIKRLRM